MVRVVSWSVRVWSVCASGGMWHGLGAAPPPYGVRRAGGGGNSGVSRVHAAGRVVLSLCVSLSTLPHLHTRTSTPHVTVVFTAAVAAISVNLQLLLLLLLLPLLLLQQLHHHHHHRLLLLLLLSILTNTHYTHPL